MEKEMSVEIRQDIETEIDLLTQSAFIARTALTALLDDKAACNVSGALLNLLWQAYESEENSIKALSYALGIEPDKVLQE